MLDNASRQGVQHNLEWLWERWGSKFHFIQGDIRDFETVRSAMEGAQVVYHLAAQVAVTKSIANPREDFEINALGTLNVLEAARQAWPHPIVVFASTNKVYGSMEHLNIVEKETRYELPEYPHGIPETFPVDFHSPYGCSKGAADQYVRDYYRIYGIPTIVFRMSCIYGPRQFGNEDQGWMAYFVLTTLRGGSLTIYGDGKQVRDVLYVNDLMDAFLGVVEHIDKTAGQVYNIGGGPKNSISIWAEFQEHLKAAIGKMPSVHYADWRAGDQKVYISDTRKAWEDFGWEPKVNLREGLEQLIKWCEELLSTGGYLG